MNRRGHGSGSCCRASGARYAKLPSGFDTRVDFDPAKFAAAVRHVRTGNSGSAEGADKGGDNDDDEGQLVASMDWDVYRRRLSDLFAAVPIVQDLQSNEASGGGACSVGGVLVASGSVGGNGQALLAVEALKQQCDGRKKSSIKKSSIIRSGRETRGITPSTEAGGSLASEIQQRLLASVGMESAAREVVMADPHVEIMVFSRVHRDGKEDTCGDMEGGESGEVGGGGVADSDDSRNAKRGRRAKDKSERLSAFGHSQTLQARGSTPLSDIVGMIR